MKKGKSWKKADYPNCIPSWRKHPCKFKKTETQLERVLRKLDYEKLAIIGKTEEQNANDK